MSRISMGVYVAVLLMLAFVLGALVTAADVFPGSFIARAYEGGRALYAQATAYDDVYASDLWHVARRPDRGVVAQQATQMQPGTTLYTSGAEAKAVLVSADGDVIHEWRRPYSSVWNESASVKQPQPDSHVYFRKAIVYPNGDLLAVYEGVGDTPYGYGVVKLDADSNVLWSYLEHTHHDVKVGPDGRIYLLTHDFAETPVEGFGNLADIRLEDFLTILSPEGTQEARIALTPLVAKSPYSHLLHTVSWYAIADPLHTNSVYVIDEANERAFPFGKAGQVLISFRELGAIGVVDVAQQTLLWATRGPWIGQHDADLLDNGNILLFDNYANYRVPEGASRVIEVNPASGEIVWSYAGTAEHPLDSAIRAEQERQPNGNTLITEASAGRIVEVTQDGRIVWDYYNPDRGGADNGKIAIVCWAQRLGDDYFDPPFTERLNAKVAASRATTS